LFIFPPFLFLFLFFPLPQVFREIDTDAGQQWLPNQLEAVLAQMCTAAAYCGTMPGLGDIMDTVHSQQKTLRKEVVKYCLERQAVA